MRKIEYRDSLVTVITALYGSVVIGGRINSEPTLLVPIIELRPVESLTTKPTGVSSIRRRNVSTIVSKLSSGLGLRASSRRRCCAAVAAQTCSWRPRSVSRPAMFVEHRTVSWNKHLARNVVWLFGRRDAGNLARLAADHRYLKYCLLTAKRIFFRPGRRSRRRRGLGGSSWAEFRGRSRVASAAGCANRR